MKRIISALCLLLAVVFILTACGGKDTPENAPGSSAASSPSASASDASPSAASPSNASPSAASPSASPSDTSPSAAPAASLTVRFMDGDNELKSESVEAGKTAAEYTPAKDGAVFLGWFATPSMNIPFDFTAPITEDIQIFAGFAVYQEDTRDFYLVGNGTSPLLLASAWGGNITDEHKLAKGAGNQYSITFDALAGDEFQFAVNSSWESQRGFGYLRTGDLPDGSKAFDVKGGLGDNTKKANIACVLDGNYTFTLTTYPAEEVDGVGKFDAITFIRNGDASATGEIDFDYYIKGETITGWGDVYDDTTKLVNDGTGKHILTISIPDDKPFLFTSTVEGTTDVGPEYVKFGNLDDASKALFDDDNGNIRAKAAGTYTFVYDAAAKTLSVTQP